MLMFFMVVVLRFAGASFCSVQLLWVQVEEFLPDGKLVDPSTFSI